MFLFTYIRYIILSTSIILSGVIFVLVKLTFPEGSLQTIRLTQLYALVSVTYLYLALFPGALYSSFPKAPLRALYFKSRRAIGVSAFFYALLHALYAFFGQLGGFEGLFFLTTRYLLAISLSFVAFIMLTAMAATSFDFIVYKLGKKWKLIHRFVYLAGVLVVIHALMLGSHFVDLAKPIPLIFMIALVLLLILESRRLDALLARFIKNSPSFGLISMIISTLSISYFLLLLLSSEKTLTFGIHSPHTPIDKPAAQQQIQSTDRDTRYTVNFIHPDMIYPNTDVELTFNISFQSNGEPEFLFTNLFTKPMHLVIVNYDLDYFSHIHPTQKGSNFVITTQFPENGTYYVYSNFKPAGAIEQQFAFKVNVGSAQTNSFEGIGSISVDDDYKTTKEVNEYIVELKKENYKVSLLNSGKQQFSFTITDKATKKPIKSLKPYLGVFGHLVMIDMSTYEYVHVHPVGKQYYSEDATGGPTVNFIPMAIYNSRLTQGVYRVFVEFNPNGKLITTNFTVRINP